MTQTAFAVACGVQKTSQINYESGEREPKTGYLGCAAALGVDVQYVNTGLRMAVYAGGAIRTDGPATVLTAEESALVDNYRHASVEGRRALAATGAALAQPAEPLKPTG